MKKTVLLFLLSGILLTACASPETKKEMPVDEESHATEEGEYKELEPFESINVAVKSADIIIEAGDEYSVRYNLHDKEPVEKIEVSDGVFRFSTGMNIKPEIDMGEWKMIITVPEETELKNISLVTVAGDIEIKDRIFDRGVMITTAGKIIMDGVNADKTEFVTVSDDIEITNSVINSIDAENTSGSIMLDGTFADIDAETVSGGIELKGEVSSEAELETVSGDINTFVKAEKIEAESIGGIMFNGAKQSKKFEIGNGKPELEIESVSGKINIVTE